MIKPVNLEALSKWVDAIPDEVKRDMSSIAPMLAKLGYDPNAYPPHYGDASQFASDNTHDIRAKENYWRQRTRAIQRDNKPQRTYSFHARGGVNSSVADTGKTGADQAERTANVLVGEDKDGTAEGNNDKVDR